MSRSSPEGGSIDPAVYAFLVEEVESIPELEALLLIWESRPKVWSSDELARRIYVEPAAAQNILKTLVRRRLISVTPERPEAYSYQSASSSYTDELIQAVATTYRQQLVRITSMIHSKPSQAVREFARAFRFKKEGS